MDAFLDTPEQLSFIFNWITGICLTAQFLFILLVWMHTPREMTTYKYTFSNTLFWSFLIALHFGIIMRPVSFLPLPVCLITGPAKYFNYFFGGHFQVFLSVLLLINKATSYCLCLVANGFALRFPMFVRRLRLNEGILIFGLVHLTISGVLVFSAYVSGFFNPTIPMSQNLLKDRIHVYSPSKYASLKPLIDDSLLIGVSRDTLHCFYTVVYLTISLAIIFINVTVMLYATFVLHRSLQTDMSVNGRNYKKRIMATMLMRTLVPMITFNLPAFFVVYVVEFDQDDTSATFIQWCLLLLLFSPTICCLGTTIALKPYRRALFGLCLLRFSRFMERRSVYSDSEQTSDSLKKRAIRNNRVAAVYSTTLSTNTDVHNNQV